MVKSIFLNSSHYVKNSTPPTFKLRLNSKIDPNQVQAIGVSDISFYNSSFNITASNLNNVISLNWLGTNYTITFPDGYYSVSDMNYFIQNYCLTNKLYMTSNSTSTPNVFLSNLSQYRLNIVSY